MHHANAVHLEDPMQSLDEVDFSLNSLVGSLRFLRDISQGDGSLPQDTDDCLHLVNAQDYRAMMQVLAWHAEQTEERLAATIQRMFERTV